MAKVQGKSDVVDIECMIKHETEKALLIYDKDEDDVTWIPKSLVEVDRSKIFENKGVVTVTMPDWFAIKEGFV